MVETLKSAALDVAAFLVGLLTGFVFLCGCDRVCSILLPLICKLIG